MGKNREITGKKQETANLTAPLETRSKNKTGDAVADPLVSPDAGNIEENTQGPKTTGPERETIDDNITGTSEKNTVKEKAGDFEKIIAKTSIGSFTAPTTSTDTSSSITQPDFNSLTILIKEQMVAFKEQMVAFKAHVEHIDTKFEEVMRAGALQSMRITTVENTVTEITKAVKANEGGMTEMVKEMEKYQREIQVLKNEATERLLETQRYHRRNNIRIVGLEEAVNCEDLNFPTVLSTILNNIDPNKVPEVDQVYRIGSRGQKINGPRVIIVTLRKTTTRDDIIKYARSQRGNLNYGGNPIFIYEDLSKDAIIRRLPYKEVMQKLFKAGYKPRLSYPALLSFLGSDGRRSGIHTPIEAEDFLNRNGANNPRQEENAGNI